MRSALVLFTRDLRVRDNASLATAASDPDGEYVRRYAPEHQGREFEYPDLEAVAGR